MAQRDWCQARLGAATRCLTRAASCGVAGHSRLAPSSRSCCSTSGIRALLDEGAQPGQGPRQARLDGAFGDAERKSRLLAAQLEEVAAGDDELVLFAQPPDQVQQALRLLRGNRCRLGGWGRIPRAEALGEPELQLLAASRRADAVAGLVRDDPQQPGSRVGALAEPAERPVRPDEAFLRGILRISGRAGDEIGGPKSNLLISLHDLLVGGRIPTLGACDEDGIFRWPALHRNASSTPGAALRFPGMQLGGPKAGLGGRWRLRSAYSSGWWKSTSTASTP